jgi:hypothetical protein
MKKLGYIISQLLVQQHTKEKSLSIRHKNEKKKRNVHQM